MLAISMIIGTIVYPILALAKIVMNMKFVGVHLTLVHTTRVAKGRETIVLFGGEFISEGAIFFHSFPFIQDVSFQCETSSRIYFSV